MAMVSLKENCEPVEQHGRHAKLDYKGAAAAAVLATSSNSNSLQL